MEIQFLFCCMVRKAQDLSCFSKFFLLAVQKFAVDTDKIKKQKMLFLGCLSLMP